MGQTLRTLELFDIKGRSALVTGGASGFGLACAEAGASVTIADIDRDGGEREAARLRAEGYESVVEATDSVHQDKRTIAPCAQSPNSLRGSAEMPFPPSRNRVA